MSAHQVLARIAFSTGLNVWDAPDEAIDELHRLWAEGGTQSEQPTTSLTPEQQASLQALRN